MTAEDRPYSSTYPHPTWGKSTLTLQEGLDLVESNPRGVIEAWLELLDETPQSQQRAGVFDSIRGSDGCTHCAMGLLYAALGIPSCKPMLTIEVNGMLRSFGIQVSIVIRHNDRLNAPFDGSRYASAADYIRRRLAVYDKKQLQQ